MIAHDTSTPVTALYYTLEIKPHHLEKEQVLVRSNSERAFIIATLQDIFEGRLPEDSCRAHKLLSVHVDLLGFSITRESARLVIFALSIVDVRNLGALIINRLSAFQAELYENMTPTRFSMHVADIPGGHSALEETLALHARHKDWESDRYSSIGFFLSDRRGAWMRTWRISRLYENSPERYEALLVNYLKRVNARRATSSRVL